MEELHRFVKQCFVSARLTLTCCAFRQMRCMPVQIFNDVMGKATSKELQKSWQQNVIKAWVKNQTNLVRQCRSQRVEEIPQLLTQELSCLINMMLQRITCNWAWVHQRQQPQAYIQISQSTKIQQLKLNIRRHSNTDTASILVQYSKNCHLIAGVKVHYYNWVCGGRGHRQVLPNEWMYHGRKRDPK